MTFVNYILDFPEKCCSYFILKITIIAIYFKVKHIIIKFKENYWEFS